MEGGKAFLEIGIKNNSFQTDRFLFAQFNSATACISFPAKGENYVCGEQNSCFIERFLEK